ncbi:MAG TPA: hypothetical protein P5295_19005 [Spirochaetota bacterium]|nr:hypothetical protein [Spirochaetota bacterium]
MAHKNISTSASEETHEIYTPAWCRRLLGNIDFDDEVQRVRARAENHALDRSAAVAIGCAMAACQLAEQAGKFAELPEEIKRVYGLPVIEDADTLSGWARRHGNKLFFEEAFTLVADIAKVAGAKTADELIDALHKFALDSVHLTIDYFMLIEHSPKTAAPAAATQKGLDVSPNVVNINSRRQGA